MSKIAIAIDSPGFGGSERDLIRLLETLKLKDPLVFLVGQQTKSEFLDLLKEHGTVCICDWVGNASRNFFAGMLTARKWVRRFINHYFIIWSHHCDSNRWLRVYLAIKHHEFSIVERAVAPTVESLRNSRLTAPLIRFISRRANHHLFCGQAQMDDFVAIFCLSQTNCKLITNSRPVKEINLNALQAGLQRQETRRGLSLSTGPLVICVGRLDAAKGQSFLIRALSELNPRVNLLLVGDGPAKEELEQLAGKLTPNRVVITKSNDPIPLLAAADIFAFPSLAEGLSGALIEAMAAGLPCVTSDIPGNRELVQHERTGLLVQPQNATALAAALRSLIDNPAESRRLAEAGYAHVLQNYDKANESSLWRILFDQVAQRE